MKKCTYRGKDAPDDATVCPLDGEPVDDPAAPPKHCRKCGKKLTFWNRSLIHKYLCGPCEHEALQKRVKTPDKGYLFLEPIAHAQTAVGGSTLRKNKSSG
jgi:hypothetical protein